MWRRFFAALMSFSTVSVKCAYERITAFDKGNLSMSQRYSAFAVSTASCVQGVGFRFQGLGLRFLG